MPLSAFAPTLPLVGQPVKVLGYTVIVSAECTCRPGVTLQCPLVVGEGRYELVNSICPHCRTVYSFTPQSLDPHGLITFAATIARPSRVDS